MSSKGGTKVRFDGALTEVGRRAIIRLPEAASKQLPSRGQVAVSGTLTLASPKSGSGAGRSFLTVIEPDGYFGHFISVDAKLQKAAKLRPGDEVRVEMEPAAEWPEPRVPEDLKQALASAPQAIRELWAAITPMARWEWVRWVNETKNPSTRKRRVEVSISKLSQGKRRPCCFNLASCTDPELAKSGKLALG
ncbi:MAG: DUF1905 domain-containing protein [Polyangiaceae bacterium]|nr:DUF1905 domain-containing protein [Polyangiaceae bacterium]